jgi:hypothetical protein
MPAYLLVVSQVLFRRKLAWILDHLLDPKILDPDAKDHTPKWAQRPLSEANAACNRFLHRLYGAGHTRQVGLSRLATYPALTNDTIQSTLFWARQNGHILHMFLIRHYMMLFSAYIALLCVIFAPLALKYYGGGGCAALVLFGLLPLVAHFHNMTEVFNLCIRLIS